jgi:hypothetical protein
LLLLSAKELAPHSLHNPNAGLNVIGGDSNTRAFFEAVNLASLRRHHNLSLKKTHQLSPAKLSNYAAGIGIGLFRRSISAAI